jgi:hypothetical protein
MQTINNYKVTIVILILGLIHLSCSTGNIINDDYYLNQEFKGKELNNISLGVLAEDIDPDTINIIDIQPEFLSRFYFLKDFREQFPIGLTYFSNFDNVQWVLYNSTNFNDSKQYSYIDENGIEKYFDLPNSMERLRNENNFDYMMYFETITIYQTDNSDKIELNLKDKKYRTVLNAKYVIWDNKNLVLVTKNHIIITSEFNNQIEHWPFKNAIMKLAAMIIDDLPMFQK